VTHSVPASCCNPHRPGRRLSGPTARDDVAALVPALEQELRTAGGPERAAKERAYLKSSLEHFGTSVPAIRAVAVRLQRSHPELGHDDVVRLVEVLWSQPVHERRMLAVEVLDRYPDRLAPADLGLVERLVRESKTWALVDGLAADVAGRIVLAAPDDAVVGATLDRWAGDDDFWVRRSALLAELKVLRDGGDFSRFARHADAMLDEKEFFIRKAIGWVLRETARTRPDEVVAWLVPRVSLASGVTLREAVKPLSDDQRARLGVRRRP
jgi:3-methyladenine DNA glycosylase AlkD